MIEINLVPDIKKEFLRSQHLRSKVISISILASLASVGLVVLLFMYIGTQAIRDGLANRDITDNYTKLTKDNPDLSKVVTIQNQLSIVSKLNNSKQVSSRIFDILAVVNPKAPNDVKISTVGVDPLKSTLTIESTANEGFNAADAFKKTILNSNVVYAKNNTESRKPLATAVTVSNTSYGEDSTGKKVLRFKLSFEYPKELTSNEFTNVRIESPTGTVDVTDSHLGVPMSLFAQPAADIQEGN